MDFFIFGHSNILGTHRNTFEFTKDIHLTKSGDCILGVGANYLLEDIQELKKYDRIKIEISIGCLSDFALATINKEFDDLHEMVFRITEFRSKRTFGIRASKAAIDFNRDIIERLKNPKNKALVRITGLE